MTHARAGSGAVRAAPAPHVVHLISSGFYGGPERQIVGIARAQRPGIRSTIGTFRDAGRGAALREAAAAAGLESFALEAEVPDLARLTAELRDRLIRCGADLLVTHHYKADLIGRVAAALARLPCCSVSHGWTAESPRVRLNERLDRLALRTMTSVVAVSREQERRVRRAGVPPARVSTIVNAIELPPLPADREALRHEIRGRFARPPGVVVGAVGRLSPEKGFDDLLTAAERLAETDPEIGTIVFGDGPLRRALQTRIEALGLTERVVLAGFDPDVRRLTPGFDLAVLPSSTEGLPVVLLEAMAVRVPVVATAVGGTPEVVDDGVTGRLVPVHDPSALAAALRELARDPARREAMGTAGRERVAARFTVRDQAAAYAELFRRLGRRG